MDTRMCLIEFSTLPEVVLVKPHALLILVKIFLQVSIYDADDLFLISATNDWFVLNSGYTNASRLLINQNLLTPLKLFLNGYIRLSLLEHVIQKK